MIGRKAKPDSEALAVVSVTERCEGLEQQIADVDGLISTARNAMEFANTAEELGKARNELDFNEIRLKALIEERLAAEEARLCEVAEKARAHYKRETEPIAPLASKIDELQRKVRDSESELARFRSRSADAMREKNRTEAIVRAFAYARETPDGHDAQVVRAHMAQLRGRLGSSGS